MVSKQYQLENVIVVGFRAVLFRMVSKRKVALVSAYRGFRAVLFRMVSKLLKNLVGWQMSFRAVLFRMVSKLLFIKDLV